jgi:hypothetical protein
MKFGVGVLYKTLSSKLQFRENRLRGGRTLLKGVNEFLPCSPLVDLGEIQYKRSARGAVEHYELHSNWRADGRAYVTGISTITFTRVP